MLHPMQIMLRKKIKRKSFLSKNLSYLIEKSSLDVKSLSAETGIPCATISRLKKVGSNPTLSSIEPLLDFFRIDIDSFLYEDLTSQRYQNKKMIGDMVHVSIFTIDDITSGMDTAKVVRFIGAAGITGKNVFGVSITSDALAPAFQNNSIVIIDPDLTPVEGDYILCFLDKSQQGVAPVFRQLFVDGSDYYFKPIKPGFGEIRHYENYKILGVVIKSIESYR